MAVITKLFSSRQKSKDFSGFKSYLPLFEPFQTWEPPDFDRDQIRLLLLQHQDSQEHSVLLDSKYHLKESQNKASEPAGSKGAQKAGASSKTNQKSAFGKKCSFAPSKKKAAQPKAAQQSSADKQKDGATSVPSAANPKREDIDMKLVQEMVFGAMDMTKQVAGIKVHTLKAPLTLMMSDVLTVNLAGRECNSETSSLMESLNLTNHGAGGGGADSRKSAHSTDSGADPGSERHAPTSAMDMPQRVPSRDLDSGVCGSLTSSGSFAGGFPCGASPGSSNSLMVQRRLHYHTRMSLESVRSLEDSCGETFPPRRMRRKLGVVLMFALREDGEAAENTKLERFLFSHFTQLQRHLSQLKASIEAAYLTFRRRLHQPVIEAFVKFQNSVYDLYTSPRLSSPVWLSMMAYSESALRQKLCSQFVQKMMVLAESIDTKSTKCFFGSLLTAVLAHHLAWVPTVMPSGNVPSRSYLDKHTAKWLDTLAKSHPYNALWAQLSDLYGSIGDPLLLTRTVVIGRDKSLIQSIVYVLSYFIRCSEVQKTVTEPTHDDHSAAVAQTCSNSSNTQGDPTHAVSVPCNAPIDTSSNDQSASSQNRRISAAGSQAATPQASSSMADNFGHRRSVSAATVICRSGEMAVPLAAVGAGAGTDSKCGSGAASVLSNVTVLGAAGVGSTGDMLSSQDLPPLEERSESRGVSSKEGSRSPSCLCEGYPRCQGEMTVNAELVEINCSDKSVADKCMCDCKNGENKRKSNGAAIQTTGAAQINGGHSNSHDSEIERRHSKKLDVSGVDTKVHEWMARNCHTSPEDYEEDVCDGHNGSDLSIACCHSETCLSGIGDALSSSEFNADSTPVGSPFQSDCLESDKPGVGRERVVMTASAEEDDAFVINKRRHPAGNVHAVADEQQGKVKYARKLSTEQSVPPRPSLPPMSIGTFGQLFSKGLMDDVDFDDDDPYENDGHNRTYDDVSEVEGQGWSGEGVSGGDLLELVANSGNGVLGTSAGASGRVILLKVKKEAGFRSSATTQQQQTTDAHIPVVSQTIQQHMSDSSQLRIASPTDAGCPLPACERTDALNGEGEHFGESCKTAPCLPAAARLTDGRTNGVSSQRRESGDNRPCSADQTNSRDPSAAVQKTGDKSFTHYLEMPLPSSKPVATRASQSGGALSSHGRDQFAAYSDHYLQDFVLHSTSEKDILEKVKEDLNLTLQCSMLDEEVDEACCIIADTDNWTVEVVKKSNRSQMFETEKVCASHLVLNGIESTRNLYNLGVTPEFCLLHLEDKLQEIYFKSQLLGEYQRSRSDFAQSHDAEDLAAVLGFDSSDISLLQSVMSTVHPSEAMS